MVVENLFKTQESSVYYKSSENMEEIEVILDYLLIEDVIFNQVKIKAELNP